MKVAEKQSKLEVGCVAHMTSKESTVDGRVNLEVAISWSPTKALTRLAERTISWGTSSLCVGTSYSHFGATLEGCLT